MFQELYYVNGGIGLLICLFKRLYIASGANDSKQFTVQYTPNQELESYILSILSQELYIKTSTTSPSQMKRTYSNKQEHSKKKAPGSDLTI